MQHKTAVIGCGLWGKNIVRNFYNLGVLDTVCDMDDDNLAMVAQNYPEVKKKLWKEYFWSHSYCLVTTGGAPLDVVKKYIENQGENHEQYRNKK